MFFATKFRNPRVLPQHAANVLTVSISQLNTSDRRDYSLKRQMLELPTAAIAAEQHQQQLFVVTWRFHNAKLSCDSVKFRTVQSQLVHMGCFINFD